jgi:hypothetical protein
VPLEAPPFPAELPRPFGIGVAAAIDFGHRPARAIEVTIDSVLTMAKEEAEKATDEEDRVRLRAYVAQFIRRTGQEAAFGDYVVRALAAAWAQLDAYVPQETLKFDYELEAKPNLDAHSWMEMSAGLQS